MENDTIFFCERFLSELYRLPITYQQITVASDFVQSPQDTDKIDAKNITTSSELKKVNIFSIRYLNWKDLVFCGFLVENIHRHQLQQENWTTFHYLFFRYRLVAVRLYNRDINIISLFSRLTKFTSYQKVFIWQIVRI